MYKAELTVLDCFFKYNDLFLSITENVISISHHACKIHHETHKK
jgi:hypothetical protein